jgi:hypothetical protein
MVMMRLCANVSALRSQRARQGEMCHLNNKCVGRAQACAQQALLQQPQ